MKVLLPFLVLPLLGILPVHAETRIYKVDFGVEGSLAAEGYQTVDALSLAATSDLSVSAADEKGANSITLQFSGDVGGFSLGNREKPITTDGIYTFGSDSKEPKNIPFTISGLPPKSLVAMYAVAAWNGPGRAAFISLGDGGVVDIGGNSPGEGDPRAVTDYTVVCNRLEVGPTGKVEGVFSNSDGSTIRSEGQWGAMILVVEKP